MTDFKDSVQEVIQGVGEYISDARKTPEGKAVEEVIQGVGEYVSDARKSPLGKKVEGTVRGVVQGVRKDISDFGKATEEVMQGVGEYISDAEQVGKAVEEKVKKGVDFAGKVVKKVADDPQSLVKLAKDTKEALRPKEEEKTFGLPNLAQMEKRVTSVMREFTSASHKNREVEKAGDRLLRLRLAPAPQNDSSSIIPQVRGSRE